MDQVNSAHHPTRRRHERFGHDESQSPAIARILAAADAS
jgi:hypothetical protein